MYSHVANYAALAASLVNLAHAIDSVTVPSTIAAGTSFRVNATDFNATAEYRVYLAAALGGDTGPTCWLSNSTTLSSNFTIPAEVGLSASYYSIGVGEVGDDTDDLTYSNNFNFTGGTGNYSEYERHLNGNPFWDAENLPCTSYECARKCADASYPDDLTNSRAYNTMTECIMKCPGVTQTSETAPPAATSASASASSAASSPSTGDSNSANGANGSAQNGACAATIQQAAVVGMASAAGFAVLFM